MSPDRERYAGGSAFLVLLLLGCGHLPARSDQHPSPWPRISARASAIVRLFLNGDDTCQPQDGMRAFSADESPETKSAEDWHDAMCQISPKYFETFARPVFLNPGAHLVLAAGDQAAGKRWLEDKKSSEETQIFQAARVYRRAVRSLLIARRSLHRSDSRDRDLLQALRRIEKERLPVEAIATRDGVLLCVASKLEGLPSSMPVQRASRLYHRSRWEELHPSIQLRLKIGGRIKSFPAKPSKLISTGP